MYWEQEKPPKPSQASPSLALTKLNEIFYLTGSQKFILKIYEQHMSETVGKERADITRGSKILI